MQAMKDLMVKVVMVITLALGASGAVLAAPMTIASVPRLADTSGIITDPACDQFKQNQAPIAGCNGTDNTPLGSKGGWLTTFVDTLIYVAGFLSFLFLIIGGIRFLTSTGDPKRVATAKNTIMYSLTGLVLAILARVIVGYIISKL
jgi:hypothetical protein